MKNNKILESVFVILFVGIFLWMFGPVLQYKLVHDRPIGFSASDAYAWFTYAKNIYESGSFKYTAPFMNLNVEGLSSPEPPLFLQTTAFLSYALGIPVHDAQILFGVLLIIFSILMFFITIKEYNPFLAYLSLPLCTFSFIFPFIAGLTYGVLPAIFGFLFLFATLYMMFHMDFRYSPAMLGVFISAMVMGHTVRIFEFVFFGGAFIASALLFKRINMVFLKRFILSCLLAFILSLYYLPMFMQRFFEGGASTFSFIPKDAARYLNITMADFRFVKYIILLGLVLCVYFLIKERRNTKGLVFTFPLTAFLLIHFLRISKVYQVTFFWPVFLSLAFGAVFFSILQTKYFANINRNKIIYLTISLYISLFLIFQYHYFDRGPKLEKISDIGVTATRSQWGNLVWIAENTELDANVLFFYFNDYPADLLYLLFSSERTAYYVPLEELDSAINQGIIKKEHKILDNSVPFFYRRCPEFPLKVTALDKNKYLKEMSLCDFDYIYGKRKIHEPFHEKLRSAKFQDRVSYTIDFMNTLLENKNFEIAHQNEEAFILRNKKPGGECI